MWSTALCGHVRQPCCTWHQCQVIAAEAELWTGSDVTALRVSAKWMVAWELGPHIHFNKTLRVDHCHFQTEVCQLSVILSVSSWARDAMRHLVFVNIVNTHWLVQGKKTNYSKILWFTPALKLYVHYYPGRFFFPTCDFNQCIHPLLFVHVTIFQPLKKAHRHVNLPSLCGVLCNKKKSLYQQGRCDVTIVPVQLSVCVKT